MSTEPLISAGVLAVVSPVLIAILLLGKDWITNRNLRLTLENIRLNAEVAAEKARIAAEEAEASKENDKIQAVRVEKIEQLSTQTHEIVNSQRSEMKAEMSAQKNDFEKTIVQLRADLRLAQVEGQKTIAPTPAAVDTEKAEAMDPNGDLSVTIPETTLPVEPQAGPSRIIKP